MIDKILMAARKLAAGHTLNTLLADALVGKKTTDFVGLKSDVESFNELVRLVDDYFNPGRSPSTCKGCGAPLVWVVTGKGSRAPLDATWIGGLDEQGIYRRIRLNHHATCPEAKR